MRHFFLALCLFLFIFTIDAQAQGQQRRFRGGPGEAPIMMALPMESAPTLDGRVTSDPAWDFVPVATGFTQTARRRWRTRNRANGSSDRVYERDALRGRCSF